MSFWKPRAGKAVQVRLVGKPIALYEFVHHGDGKPIPCRPPCPACELERRARRRARNKRKARRRAQRRRNHNHENNQEAAA